MNNHDEAKPLPSPANAVGALATEYWDKTLEADPVRATLLGDRRFDDRLADRSPAARVREREWLTGLLARVVEAVDDSLDARVLIEEIGNDLLRSSGAIEEWSVSSVDGPQVDFFNLGSLQSVTTPADGRAMAARWSKMDASIDERIANLRLGLAGGRVAPRILVERVAGVIDALLGQPVEEWALLAPASAPHPDWKDGELAAFRRDLNAAVRERIRPALARYRDFLRVEVAPLARPDDNVGISALPGGTECYANLIRLHTSLDLTADEVHVIGLEEIARIRAEMSELGNRIFGTEDIAAIQGRLRGDPGLYFRNREEVEQKAVEALQRAGAAAPQWIGTLSKQPCAVRRIEAHEEKDSTIAYYREPAMDGSRPGTYYVNTYAPETRPRYEAEALAFHESIPGHHTQIARAQELADIPTFRKYCVATAYVEGWGLYSERLADEMGLYSADLDRLGMLSFDAWRACRLVVDTGLHAKGWSRQQAIDTMLTHTLLAENNVVNEIDRYISWPGQALAYKIGQRQILRLRALAKERLGPRFDIRAFHDVVLGSGAVSLRILEENVLGWITAKL